MPWTRLLASDLDGTLIPPEDLPGARAALEAFARALSGLPGCALAYVTGRHRDLALEGLRRWRLPRPQFLSGDVGASLYAWEDGRWRPLEDYRRRLEARLRGRSLAELGSELASLPGLTPQEPERQAEFKCSFYVDPAAGPELEEEVAARTRRWGFPPPTLIASREAETGRGLLDLLPGGVDKATPLRFLAERLDLPPERVLFAGDSGNDLRALDTEFLGVLVGNAPEELRRRLPRREGLHLAGAPYAAGVLEALERFGWLSGA